MSTKIKEISIYHNQQWSDRIPIGVEATNVDFNSTDINMFGTDPTPASLSSFLNTTFKNKINTGGVLYCSSVDSSITASTLTPTSINNSLVRIEDKIDNYVPNNIIQGYFYNNKFYNDSVHNQQITGTSNKIYIDLTTNKSYRYASNNYIVISGGDSGGGGALTVRPISSTTITVSANDNYAFDEEITIPTVADFTPISISGFELSDGEASFNKMIINNGKVQVQGTVLLNGSDNFTIMFNILYVATNGLVTQADNINY